MTEEQFDEWIAALEDPETKKGKYYLKDKNGGMCCLGVLAIINDVPHGIDEQSARYAFTFPAIPGEDEDTNFVKSSYPPNNWMGMRRTQMGALASINDANNTFEPVIKYLKDNKSDFVE